MSLAVIAPKSLYERIQAGEPVEVLDVRTPAEFGEVHIPIAKNIPLDQLDADAVAKARRGAGKPLYVVCRSGGRGKMACEKLIAAGLGDVVNVDGGTLAWDQAGLPVVRGEKCISLERQVRIAAGSLVLAGVALSLLVHPYLIGLSAFVGAGLVFAGITDTCGMGMLLAKMPWNQASAPAAGHEAKGAACCSR